MMTLEIILLVMAAVGVIEGLRLSKSVLLFADPVGPGWYLFFMSCLLVICALALLVRSLKRRKAGQQRVSLSLQGFAGRVVFLLFLYALAITYLGYGIASTIFFVWVQRFFGERSWARCAIYGVAITGCFYLVFSSLAKVPLPQGLFIK